MSWTNIKDGLPENALPVLGYDLLYGRVIVYYDDNGKWNYELDFGEFRGHPRITDWHVLTESPPRIEKGFPNLPEEKKK